MQKVRKLTLILSLFVLLISPLQASSGEPYNYYVPAPDRLLENVEKYHLQQGIDKIKKGKFEYAWSEFAFMLHYFPNHPIALKHIGELSIQMEQHERGQKYFDRAVKLYPHEAATYALYGIFMHKVGHYEQAIAQYQQALNLDSSPAEYHYNLGLAYLALQDYKNANQAAQKAYSLGYPLDGLKNKLVDIDEWQPKA